MLDACWGVHSVLNQGADEKINKGELLNAVFHRVGFRDFLLTMITGREKTYESMANLFSNGKQMGISSWTGILRPGSISGISYICECTITSLLFYLKLL